NASSRRQPRALSAPRHWWKFKKSSGAPGPDTPIERRRAHRDTLMQTVTELGPKLGVRPLCAALGLAPATYYRRRRAQAVPSRQRPTTSPRALTPAERQRVLDVLHEPRFVDLAPAQVYATLLD